MNTRRIQGLALILAAVCTLITLIPSVPSLFQIVGIILFIIGIPAVHASQPSGLIGLIGTILIILAAGIALGFHVGLFGGQNFAPALILTSAISGTIGRLIVGWLTLQKRVFSQWIGWAFIVAGLLIGGLINIAALSGLFSVVSSLAEAAAEFGYGFHIFRETKS